ncbi:MAG: type II toxin-antitoxin system VapC family toxin [Acidobacteria bacterium]|nr:type II toxin-antitoxin system VapC family toxin [Acidobacteriota bacterium]
MTAVDTNLLVRFLVADDQDQFVAVQAALAVGPVWIAETVLLDTAWHLRKDHGFDEAMVCDAFKKLLDTTNIVVEDSNAVRDALDLVSQGLQIADAMHLTSRPPGATFLSFDKALVRRAQRAGVPLVAHPPKPH